MLHAYISSLKEGVLITFSWVDYSLIHDCDWWIPLVKLIHMGVVWTSRDKTLRFYWLLKFGQLPTHPSLFSPWKSCHAWQLKGMVVRRKWRRRILTNFVHFFTLDNFVIWLPCLYPLRFWYVSFYVWEGCDIDDVTDVYLTGDGLWCSLGLALDIVRSRWPNQWRMNCVLCSI